MGRRQIWDAVGPTMEPTLRLFDRVGSAYMELTKILTMYSYMRAACSFLYVVDEINDCYEDYVPYTVLPVMLQLTIAFMQMNCTRHGKSLVLEVEHMALGSSNPTATRQLIEG
jgi:hypothetical protein